MLARLVKFYINPILERVISSSQICPSGFSHHSAILLTVSNPGPKYKSAYWKFNNNLLDDVTFKQAFTEVWCVFIASKGDFCNLMQCWDNTETHMRLFCQQYRAYTS